MLKFMRNTILILLVLGALGVVTKMVEEPNKYWVFDQISEHGGDILDVSKNGIEFKIGDRYISGSWEYVEDYFKELND